VTGKRQAAVLSFVLVLALAPPLYAQGLDPAAADALARTLRVLTDPAARSLAIGSNAQMVEIDRQVGRLAASPELAQEIYTLATEVLADVVRGAGGDLGKMSEALERGKADPAGFAAMLSPETLARLRALAVKLSDTRR